eukprot:TRINITY_DN7017_c0_g1_i1.p1 TRINITY_DN7017_c0_g1~~TRINITY_DN7017_c0_g1_i1.p1  ORF type:complete len:300 (-),score=85.29 TRINITY_DN7017_c0_g1_i1:93-992(-)
MKLQGSKAAFALLFAGLFNSSEGFSLRAGRDDPPPAPPAPDPTVIWVNEWAVAGPPPQPTEENCFGCQCLSAFPGGWLVNATLQDPLTCLSGDNHIIPDIRWGGPKDHSCRVCQSFAMTIEDLDYPNGMGSPDNHIKNIYWIANIPGDWQAINKTAVVELGDLAPAMVVGQNSKGQFGMEPACPERGIHRYRVILWALDSSINDLGPATPYQELKTIFQEHELARSTWHAQLSASKFVDVFARERAAAAAASLAGVSSSSSAAIPAAQAQDAAAVSEDATSAPSGSFLGFAGFGSDSVQ